MVTGEEGKVEGVGVERKELKFGEVSFWRKLQNGLGFWIMSNFGVEQFSF